MLNDRDIENVLRRYRVADPPSGLGPVLEAAIEAPREYEWLRGPAATIAILAAWIAFHVGRVDTPFDPVRAGELALVTEMLGGDAYASACAELIVPPTLQKDPLIALAENSWLTN